jgi:hypothetical protein
MMIRSGESVATSCNICVLSCTGNNFFLLLCHLDYIFLQHTGACLGPPIEQKACTVIRYKKNKSVKSPKWTQQPAALEPHLLQVPSLIHQPHAPVQKHQPILDPLAAVVVGPAIALVGNFANEINASTQRILHLRKCNRKVLATMVALSTTLPMVRREHLSLMCQRRDHFDRTARICRRRDPCRGAEG